MKKLFQIGVISVLSLGMGMTALADGKKPSKVDAIEYRHAVFEVIAWHFGPLGAMVKGKMPFEAKIFAEKAANVASLSKMPLEGFVPGSHEGDTDAKAEIWTNWDDFKSKMTSLQEETAKLAEVAKTATKVEEIKEQFGKTAKVCKGCHEDYKAD
jgi:cytochrome c556